MMIKSTFTLSEEHTLEKMLAYRGLLKLYTFLHSYCSLLLVISPFTHNVKWKLATVHAYLPELTMGLSNSLWNYIRSS